MDITPALKVGRFAQLTPGDLFIFAHDSGSCVALKVVDPANDGDELILTLGPRFPACHYRSDSNRPRRRDGRLV